MQCIYYVKKSIFLYLKYVGCITLLGISFSAFSSDDINYDPYAQVRAEQFEAFTSNTVSCMEVRARGALLQGIRDSEKNYGLDKTSLWSISAKLYDRIIKAANGRS